MGERCDQASHVNTDTFAAAGRDGKLPMLWLYSENDRNDRSGAILSYHRAFIAPSAMCVGRSTGRSVVSSRPRCPGGSFDHLVCPGEQGGGDGKTECPGGSEIDHELEPRRLLDR
jgi:hypothetical protein